MEALRQGRDQPLLVAQFAAFNALRLSQLRQWRIWWRPITPTPFFLLLCIFTRLAGLRLIRRLRSMFHRKSILPRLHSPLLSKKVGGVALERITLIE